jgi:hypothetical protein
VTRSGGFGGGYVAQEIQAEREQEHDDASYAKPVRPALTGTFASMPWQGRVVQVSGGR